MKLSQCLHFASLVVIFSSGILISDMGHFPVILAYCCFPLFFDPVAIQQVWKRLALISDSYTLR